LDTGKCSKCGRDVSPLISKLVGYLNVARYTDGRFQSAVNEEGEFLVKRFGFTEQQFLRIAQPAAQEALRRNLSEVKAFCADHLPTMLCFRPVGTSDHRTASNWELIAGSTFAEIEESLNEASNRAKCPICGQPGATLSELRKEATAGPRPVAIVCNSCGRRIEYEEYLRFNGEFPKGKE
jgi:hypothetical protein